MEAQDDQEGQEYREGFVISGFDDIDIDIGHYEDLDPPRLVAPIPMKSYSLYALPFPFGSSPTTVPTGHTEEGNEN